MASIPLPALNAHAPQPENPLDQMSKVIQLKSLMQSQQAQQQRIQEGAIQLQQQQQQQKDRQTFQQVLQKNAGDMDKTLEDTKTLITPEYHAQIAGQYDLDLQRKSMTDKRQLDIEQKQTDSLMSLLDQAKGMSPEQYQQMYPQIVAQAKQIKPDLKIPDGQMIPQQALDGLTLGLNTSQYVIKKAKAKQDEQEAADKHALAQANINKLQNPPEPDTEVGLAMKAIRGDEGAQKALDLIQKRRIEQTKAEAQVKADIKGDLDISSKVKDRAALSDNVMENISNLEDIIKRRPDLFGKVRGLMSKAGSLYGSSDPDVVAYDNALSNLMKANIGMHNMRSKYALESGLKNLKYTNAPDANLAGLAILKDSAQQFKGELGADLSKGSSGSPKVGDIKKFPNGKTGKWDGQGWVQQ